MRPSRFNVYIPDYPDTGDTLVYNHLTGGMAVLDGAGRQRLAALERGESDCAGLDELADPQLGILVPDAAEDERRFATEMDRRRKNTRHVSVIVSTSLACNFGCPYCVQGEVMNGKTMDFATVYETGRWIGDRVRLVGASSVTLTFIGGEPLLHPHIIERIAKHVGGAARNVGIAFDFDLVTNGYYLDRAMAERLRALGCSFAKVTLDGDETTHDRTRPLKGGKSSFGKIWDNLKTVAPILPILLNGNFTEQTLSGFRPLLDKLRQEGFDGRMIRAISFTPALAGLMVSRESTVCRSPRMSESFPEEITALAEAIEDSGFRTYGDGTSLGPCGFHNAQHFAIDPEGHVYKCPGFLGLPKFAIGHVRGAADELGPLYARALSPTLLGECRDCGSRPSCAGGCVAAAWIESGGPGEVQCDKPYFQTVAVDAIKRKWRRDQQAA